MNELSLSAALFCDFLCWNSLLVQQKHLRYTKYIWYNSVDGSDKGDDAMPLSGKEMYKLFRKVGYELVPGGKGSHLKLKKKGCETVIIPNHDELKKGLEHALRKILEKNKD